MGLKGNVAEALKALDLARELLAGAFLPDRICETCNGVFTPQHPSARYCSGKCRQSAYRNRRRDVPTEIS